MSPRPLLSFAAAATLASGLSTCGGEAPAASRPDVVFVVVDTLRADHMSLYGYGLETTPLLDRRAQEGLVFDHALAGSSWTVPSMAMLFTGSYQVPAGRRLADDVTTFPESFQRAGYRTAGVVSNPILGRVTTPGFRGRESVTYDSGFERGFEHFDVFQHTAADGQAAYGQTNGWYGEEVVRRGIEWVESEGTGDSGEPYLLYLHLFDPHFPRVPQDPDRFAPGSYAEPFEALDPALAVGRESELAELEDWARGELALYDAEVAHVDEALEGLFTWLDERGTLDETVVVLTSDHGEGLWQRPLPKGEQPKPYNRMGALYSDHGIQLYDEQVRVPLVIWSPLVEPGRVEESVSLLDIVPSLHYLADLPAPPETDGPGGVSLFDDGVERSTIFSLISRGTSVTVDGRWRLHLPVEHRRERFGARTELYDLREDPAELRPLDDPELEADLLDRIRSMQALMESEPELSEEEAAARRALLDSLGYTDQ